MRKLRIVLIVLGLAVIAHIGTGWFLAVRYEAQLEAIRLAGEPVLPTELATEPVPDAENVAVGLREAAEWLARHPAPDALERAGYDSGMAAEDLAEIKRYLVSIEPCLDMVEAALERPGYHLDVDWDAGPGVEIELIPHVLHIVNAFRHWALHRQDPATLNDRIVRAARVCHRLGERCRLPFVIGHLVQETARSMVIYIVTESCDQPGFDAARLRRELDPFLQAAERGPPARPLIEERTGALWMFERWRSGRATGLDGLGVSDRWYASAVARPIVYLDGSRFLGLMRDAIEGCDVSPREALQRPRHPDLRWPHNVASLFVGLPQKLFWEYGGGAARFRLCRIALALMARGEWPATLAELGDLPTDPFSGEAFLYERTDTRVRLWSARTHADAEGEKLWEHNADAALAWEWKR